MSKLVSFLVYNIIVYVLYAIIDSVFSFFDVYSNPQLGTDLFIMPTDKDLVYKYLTINNPNLSDKRKVLVLGRLVKA